MKLSLRRLILDKKEAKVLACHKKYFSTMEQTLPEDIFIAGYPKSGNTWFQNLVSGLVFGVLSDKSPPRLSLDLVPDVHETDLYYQRYQTPTYFKTHHKPLPQYRNVVYLLRDGRDVMVSYWHFLEAMERKKINFLHMVQSGQGLFPCKWHEHVAAWMANPHQARMIVIKYEDLLSEPVKQLERFCAFSGIEADPAFLETISQGASFKQLQKREKNKGEGSENWPKDKLFHRRGVAGSFRDEMPEEVLQAFLSDAKVTLEQNGYDV
jgi:hypothetical protein